MTHPTVRPRELGRPAWCERCAWPVKLSSLHLFRFAVRDERGLRRIVAYCCRCGADTWHSTTQPPRRRDDTQAA